MFRRDLPATARRDRYPPRRTGGRLVKDMIPATFKMLWVVASQQQRRAAARHAAVYGITRKVIRQTAV